MERKTPVTLLTTTSGQPLQHSQVPTFTTTGFYSWENPVLQFHDVIVSLIILRLYRSLVSGASQLGWTQCCVKPSQVKAMYTQLS